MNDTLLLQAKDSLHLILSNSKLSQDNPLSPILTIVISIIGSIILAYLTSIFTKKIEIKKILLGIQNDNFKILYQEKLSCLKILNQIVFERFRLKNINHEDYNPDVSELYNKIGNDVYFLKPKFRELNIDYSFLFQDEIITIFNEIYDICNKVDSIKDRSEFYTEGEKIYNLTISLIKKIQEDLLINSTSMLKFESKVSFWKRIKLFKRTK